MPVKLKLFKKPSQRDGWYEIPPADAQWLLDHGSKNRPLREHKAQRIAAEIQAGTWRPNGESIIFDEKGRLLDGQHRLRGCVLSNRPIIAYCVFDVPAKYFPSFDQGMARGGNDLAALMGFANANSIAAVARLAIQYTDGTITKTGQQAFSTEKLRLYMDRNEERLKAAVETANHFQKGIVRLLPFSHAAWIYYMTAPASNGKASDFIERLATGAGLHKGDALLLFRSRMQDLIGEKHKLTKSDRLALLIKTWNSFASGRQLGTLKWNSEVEQFPTIETQQ